MKELSNISNETWYSKKKICELVKCDEKTLRRFKKSLMDIDVHQTLILKRAPRLGGDLYSEDSVKHFVSFRFVSLRLQPLLLFFSFLNKFSSKKRN